MSNTPPREPGGFNFALRVVNFGMLDIPEQGPARDIPIPDRLVVDYEEHIISGPSGPVLDLACGDGHNGIYLALRGVPVVCLDISEKALLKATRTAKNTGVKIMVWKADLESPGHKTLPHTAYSAILVFRYLFRPLIEEIKDAVKPGGLVVYETFTEGQARFDKPKNPDHLLKYGELKRFFADWNIMYWFEGLLEEPRRAVAQVVARKPRA